MASKVIVKMPVAPFGQVSKSKSPGVNSDLVQVRQSLPDGPPKPSTSEPQKPEDSRIAQLEQNIKFLQEQHQLMLSGLHHEIDNLRHRNRELQFQLVFVKGTSPSSPSSPEDETKPKVYSPSPKQLNVTPLQVEILEKELSEVKLNLQEIESRNVYLSAIADEQKKKLERYERERERERERSLQPDAELIRKLEDAEILIRRLRQENADLRRENTSSGGSSSSNSYQSRDGQHQHRGNNHSNGGRGNRGYRGNYRGNWFPPLHTQNYWQNSKGNDRNQGHQNLQSGHHQQQQGQQQTESTSSHLPNIPHAERGGGSGQQYQGRRGSNNNHYHNNGEGRKYRGHNNRGHKPSS